MDRWFIYRSRLSTDSLSVVQVFRQEQVRSASYPFKVTGTSGTSVVPLGRAASEGSNPQKEKEPTVRKEELLGIGLCTYEATIGGKLDPIPAQELQ